MAGRHRQRSQRGAALLVFLVLLVMGALTWVVSNLTPETVEAARARKTAEALAQARDALIGYAAQYRDQQNEIARIGGKPLPNPVYGYLPLPDFGESVNLNSALAQSCTTEGCTMINPANLPAGIAIGRFPWKTVGTGPLRDGHGECLWYAVSTSHRALNPTAGIMNWDTLVSPDLLIGSGRLAFASGDEHERPIAVIFSPGPAFDAGRAPSADASICGGNYDSSRYVDPAINNTQRALPITSAELYRALWRGGLRDNTHPPDRRPSFGDDINDMLDQLVIRARDKTPGGCIGTANKVNDDCSLALDTLGPQGYYKHYRDQVFIKACPGCTVNSQIVCPTPDAGLLPSPTAPPGIAGVLLFGGTRDAGQVRRNDTEKNDANSYLESNNLAGTVFSGLTRFGNLPPALSPSQDIVRCIPDTPSQKTVSLDLSALFPGVTSLATYLPATQTLTLGATNAQLSSTNINASKLFGCSWLAEPRARGNGFRSYFRFKIRDTGDGFSFAIVDDARNAGMTRHCGAAGQHLGYSGNNGFTPPILSPKIAIEFDTSRNAGFTESGNHLTNGRYDPDYTPPYDNDSHVAIMYWGHETTNPTAGVSLPGQDDNVHGFPLTPDTSVRPAPRNAVPVLPHPFPAPYPPPAIVPLDRLRNTAMVNRDFHVRLEVTPLPRSAADETNKRRTWKIEAWIEPTYAKAITSLVWTQDSATMGTVTVTAPGHDFSNGDQIMIREAPGSFNGDYIIHNSNKLAGTFKFSKFPDPGTTVLVGQPVAMKLGQQAARMRATNLPMSALSPVVKYGQCTSDANCGSSQSCSGVEADGFRYCYAGHQPTVSDRPVIYDIDLGGGSYHDALGSIRLGFTIGIGSSDQVIDISEFFTTWLH